MDHYSQIKPKGKRVLLRTSAPDKVTPGGIHLPDVAQEGKAWLKVVAVGPDVTKVAVNQLVVPGTNERGAIGRMLVLGDDHVYLVHEDDILATVEQYSPDAAKA
jgi:co-chaperonin GroES (HSP10)